METGSQFANIFEKVLSCLSFDEFKLATNNMDITLHE